MPNHIQNSDSLRPEPWEYRYKYYSNAGDKHRNLKVISDSKIWYSQPRDLNDPFDCAPTAATRDQDALRETAIRLLKRSPGKYANRPNLTFEEKVQHTITLFNQGMTGPEFVSEFVSVFSILCLSRDPVNELMWAHYGSSHTGFALEFDIQDSYESEAKSTLPDEGMFFLASMAVNYINTRPKFDGPTHDLLFSKSLAWSYENEERIVFEGKHGLQPFNPYALKSIILGANADNKLKDQISYRVGKLGKIHQQRIKIYQVALDDTEYKLWIPEHPYFGDRDYLSDPYKQAADFQKKMGYGKNEST